MAIPGGTVSLYNGSSLITIQNLDANGNASFSHTFTAGVYALNVKYSGDANFNSAVSDTQYLTVNSPTKANVVISLAASPNPAQTTDTVTVGMNVASA